MGKVYLSNQQKNLINEAVAMKKNCVLFQTANFDSSRRIVNTETHAAAVGDVCNFLLHGLTFGSMFYSIQRESNWCDLAERVYSNGLNNKLKAYRNSNQVIVVGGKYLTVYQEGESQRRQMYFDKVVQVLYEGGKIVVVAEDAGSKRYSKINIYNLGSEMKKCLEVLVLYAMRASSY